MMKGQYDVESDLGKRESTHVETVQQRKDQHKGENKHVEGKKLQGKKAPGWHVGFF
jgi:hypothetical protein